jgi:hypothetical protein
MTRGLFRQQIRVALVPCVSFVMCAIAAVVHRGTAEGSAVGGFVRDGKYVLSLGHGAYQETSRDRFEAVRRHERIVLGCFAGMAMSALGTALLLKRAGIPLESRPKWRSPAPLRPRRGGERT